MYSYIEYHFPGGPDSKDSACQCRRPGLGPWIGKIPWRREWQPTPVFLPGEFHGQRSLVDHTVRGITESWTELGSFHFHMRSSVEHVRVAYVGVWFC